MALESGEVIDGKYRIVRVIGEGGMGAVYEAEHARIHRRVAIKVLHPMIAADQGVVQRFEREAQAAGRIGNDHILEVLDLGNLPDGARYMVMEFLDGEPLGERIKKLVKLTPQQITPLVRQILVALDAAHAAGIIHRDLKPDNVFVLHSKAGSKDFVKLIDFGISKFSAMSGEKLGMTKTGAVIGTPYYMSPEQAAGTGELDRRADLYAVGVILYEAVTGSVPFLADSFNQLIIKIALTDPPPAKAYSPELDDAFVSIISKAMARDPGQRFQSAGEFIEALDAWVASGAAVTIPPPTAMPPGLMHPVGSAAAVTLATPVHITAPRPDMTPRPDAQSHPPAITAGNWAASQSGMIEAKPQSKKLLAAVAAGCLVFGAIGAIALILFLKRSPATPPAGAEALVTPAAQPAAQPANEPGASPPAAPTLESPPPAPAAPTDIAVPNVPAKPGAPAIAAKPGVPGKPGAVVVPGVPAAPVASVAPAPPPPAPVPAAPPPPPPPKPAATPKPGNDFGY